jgi:hypothetical protein
MRVVMIAVISITSMSVSASAAKGGACRRGVWSLSSRSSPRTSLSNKRRLSQLGRVESRSYASTNFATSACLSNLKLKDYELPVNNKSSIA